MRKTMILITTLFVFSVFTNTLFAADVAKIGVVDMQKVLAISDSGKAIKAELSKIYKDMETDLEKKKAEIDAMEEQFKKESMVMSNELREEKRHEINMKALEGQRQKQKYEKQLQRMQMEKLGKLQKEVSEIVTEIGKKEGYLLIVDRAAVMYSPNDITDRVIQTHNKKYAK